MERERTPRSLYPKEWLQDAITRKDLTAFYGKKPQRTLGYGYLLLNEDQNETWPDTYKNLELAYFKRHPSYVIEIETYGEPKTKGGKRRNGAQLIHKDIRGINYWNKSIPEGKEIHVDTADWAKLAAVLNKQRPGDDILMRGYDHVFVVVNVKEKLNRPYGTLAQTKVRDATQATPTHPNIMVSLTPQGYVPNDQPIVVEGDCLPRAVLTALKPSWDKNFKNIPLTIAYILAICECESEMNIYQLEPFIERYRISTYLHDIKGNVIYEKDFGDKRNKKICSRLDLLIHNKHITLYNYDLTSFVRKPFSKLTQLSKHYKEARINKESHTIRTYEELKAFILAKSINSEHERVYYQPLENEPELKYVFCKLRRDIHLEAKITLSNSYDTQQLIFHHPPISIVGTNMNISTLKQLTDALTIPSFKSHYSSSVQRVFNDCTRGPLVRNFIPSDKPLYKIDQNRAYTARLLELEYIPVLTFVDEFIPYDNSPLEPYIFYLVRGSSLTPERWLILNREWNVVSGYVLQHSQLHFFDIKAMCKPSTIVPNSARNIIKTLYKDPTNPDLKHINLAIGMAGKLRNKKTLGTFATNSDELFEFENKFPPIPYPDCESPEGYLIVDAFDSVELVDGYYPIQLLIYDLQRLAMLDMYRTLKPLTNIYGIRTDCLYVDTPLKFHEGPKTLDTLGKYRLEEEKGYCPSLPIELYLTPEQYIITKVPMQVITDLKEGTLIEGDIPGTGKTFKAVEFMGCLLTQPTTEHKSLIVCYSDKSIARERARTKNCDIVSYAKVLGNRVDDDGKQSEMKVLDVSSYKYILFDEILQINQNDYIKLLKLYAGKPNILATGDLDQNGYYTLNNKSREEFYASTLWKLFPFKLTLTESKRLKTHDDEQILKAMKHAWKHERKSIHEVIQPLIDQGILNNTTTLDAFQNHICYKNETCNVLEETYGNRPSSLTFDKYDKDKAKLEKLAKDLNIPIQKDVCHYLMVEGKRRQFLVRGEVYPVEYSINKEHKHDVKIGQRYYSRTQFLGTHAKTGFSAQGDTIPNKFAILEWDHYYADWKWLFTAITRCTKLSDVYFYIGPSLVEDHVKNIDSKLKGHLEYDTKMGYDNDLTKTWVKETLKKQRYTCACCGDVLSLNYTAKDGSQFVIDRRDDSQGHLQSNCRIVHDRCNKSLAAQNHNSKNKSKRSSLE